MWKRQSAAIVASAVLPAAVSMLIGVGHASAGMTLSVTNQGPATDNSGHTTTGWTGYVITVQADAGDFVSAVDLGSSTTSTNGIFGALLQKWSSSKAGAAATPLGDSSTDTNGADDGTDSHWLAQTWLVAGAMTEDSDQLDPAGAPADEPGSIWGTGTYLHGEAGIQGAFQLNSQPIAYIVVRDGTTALVKLDAVERVNNNTIFHLAATIPEPMTGSLMCCAATFGLLRRPRQRRL